MTPMTGLVRARSRMDFKELIRHAGQELVFVISGQSTLYCEGRDPIALAAGERYPIGFFHIDIARVQTAEV